MALLDVINVSKKFGGLRALDSVSFSVEPKSILGLVGPNGSGKTTMFNVMTGFLKADEGQIIYQGRNITNLKPYRIARAGIGRTFQLTKPFNRLTVLQNLLVASPIADIDRSIKKADELLKFVELEKLREEEAWNLSYGQMKLLELARVLMFDPSLVLLDEPTAGVNPVLKDKIMEKLKELNSRGKAFIVIEHDMRAIGQLCEKAIVLVDGKVCLEAAPCDLIKHDAVREAYFL
jgi:ABC-type branched-subunit amino acid transport system ATPase component